MAQEARRVAVLPSTDFFALTSEENDIYAASFGQVYRSHDGGETWTGAASFSDATGDVSTLFAHDGIVYTGTIDSGVFASLDQGDSWVDYNTGLTGFALRITAFAVRGDSLFAGTDGAGVQVLNLQMPMAGWKPFNTGLAAQGIQALALSDDVLVAAGGVSGSVYVRHRTAGAWAAVALDAFGPGDFESMSAGDHHDLFAKHPVARLVIGILNLGPSEREVAVFVRSTDVLWLHRFQVIDPSAVPVQSRTGNLDSPMIQDPTRNRRAESFSVDNGRSSAERLQHFARSYHVAFDFDFRTELPWGKHCSFAR